MRQAAQFADCLGTVVTGVQDYYATGSNELIDGMFREAEVEILLKDYDLRKPQYRPDVVALVVPAAIEGLFDPNFKLPKLPRHAHRRLRVQLRRRARQRPAGGWRGTRRTRHRPRSF